MSGTRTAGTGESSPPGSTPLILLCLALVPLGLGAFWAGGSIFADARTEKITGRGVDVRFLDAFAGPGDTMEIEVEARGGARAGIDRIEVIAADGTRLAEAAGGGASWGSSITEGKSRGSETIELAVLVPPAVAPAGGGVSARLEVDYVVAATMGNTFENETEHASVAIVIRPLTFGGLLRHLALPFAAALVWGLLCVVFAARVPGLNERGDTATVAALISGLTGAGILAYWTFARPIQSLVGVSHWVLSAALIVGWYVAPAWWVRRRRSPPARAGAA